MMADVLMVVVTIGDEKSIEGWCPIKLRALEVQEVAMVALLRAFAEGSNSKSRLPFQAPLCVITVVKFIFKSNDIITIHVMNKC